MRIETTTRGGATIVRLSELAQESGTPTPTIKYYLREGLLAPGAAVSARESSYGPAHVTRLRLIRGLVHVVGMSVTQVRALLRIIDDRSRTPLEAIVGSTVALPLTGAAGQEAPTAGEARIAERLRSTGLDADITLPYVRDLVRAVALAEDCGLAMDDRHLAAYLQAARLTAAADLARLSDGDHDEAVTAAVLGTIVYEPILLGLRRLAHRELVDRAADVLEPRARTGGDDAW